MTPRLKLNLKNLSKIRKLIIFDCESFCKILTKIDLCVLSFYFFFKYS